MSTTSGVSVATLFVIAVSSPATAQEEWPFTIEANIGFGAGSTTGVYKDNDVGLAAGILLGHRLFDTEKGHAFGAVAVDFQGGGPTTSECIQLPEDGCVPEFPSFEVASIMAGWERRSTGIRILGGPSAVRAYGDWKTIKLGWTARLDAAAPLFGRIALVGSLRAMLLPSYAGERFQLISLGGGLRLR